MHNASVRALVLVTLLTSVHAFAYRREYVITWEGQRKAGSEVCFYRGAAGDAFSLFFTAGDVRCLPADAVLDFPPGVIHAFARHKDGYASAQRDFTVYDGPPIPEQGYQKLETPLVRAGTVDFADILKNLPSDQRLGLWISSTQATAGTFIPLVPGETTILAPAGFTVVPLMIEDRFPIRVGEPLYLEPGERQPASFPLHPGTSDVIVSTRLDFASMNEAHSLLVAPSITLKAGGHTIRPVAPLFVPEPATLLIFRDVPPGNVILEAEGSMWKATRREMTVLPRAVTVEREPVALIAGGSVVVKWPAEEERASNTGCPAARTNDLPMVRAALLRCSTGDQPRCTAVASSTAPFDSVSMNFAGVAAGTYTLAFEPPYGKRVTQTVDVSVGRQTNASVVFSSFSFFGTVTVNGKPLRSRLIFASGQAVSDAGGHFNATLAADPTLNQVQIEPCDASRTFRFVPRTAPAPNSVYDIDLRVRSLRVNVTDSGRNPVAGASVRFSPIKEVRPEGNVTYFGSPEKQTDDGGRVSFDDVPDGFPVSVCARHKDFASKCSGSLDLNSLGDGPAVIQFDPVGMHVRIEGHTGPGEVAAVSPAGVITEEAAVDEDGSVILRMPHGSPEHLIYVSQSRPLTVVPLPLASPPELLIHVPPVPIRTFDVTVPNMTSRVGYLGIWIGGMFVPVQVLNAHMEMRGLDSMIHRGTSLRVPDIAETGPITVAFGVEPPEITKGWVDPFILPQYAGVQQHRVEGSAITLSQ